MASLGEQWEGRVMARQGRREQGQDGSPPRRGREHLPGEVGQVFNHPLGQRDLRSQVENRSSDFHRIPLQSNLARVPLRRNHPRPAVI